MSFSEQAKLTALAIVKVFETGKPVGDYSALAVLKDGAGISYGINQFTHRSGSLYDVLHRYLLLGGTFTQDVAGVMTSLRDKKQIAVVANNSKVKAELKTLGKSPLMQRAQREIAYEKYLKPALEACEGSGFKCPLSLAVIYDSINHGSYKLVRNRVKVEGEKAWITQYCIDRKRFLANHDREILHNTVNRPQTFLDLIQKGNWNLDLPLAVRLGDGRVMLTSSILAGSGASHTLPSDKPDSHVLAEEQGGLESAIKPPISDGGTEATITEKTGDATVTVTQKNEQDANKPAVIDGGRPYMGIGFWKVIKRDLLAAFGGNLSFASFNEYVQQASGWPPWMTAIIGKIAVGALIATAVYFIARVIHYFVDRWQNNERVKTEAAALTAIDRKDITWV